MREKPNVPIRGKRFGNSGRKSDPIPVKRYLEPLAARMRIASDDIAEVHLYPGLIRFKLWDRHPETGDFYRDDSGEVASKTIEYPIDTESDDLKGYLHDYLILRKRFEGIDRDEPLRGRGRDDGERIGPVREAAPSVAEPEPAEPVIGDPEPTTTTRTARAGRITLQASSEKG